MTTENMPTESATQVADLTTTVLRRFAVSQGERASSWTRERLEAFYVSNHGKPADNVPDAVSEASDDKAAAKRRAIELLLGTTDAPTISEARIIELIREHSIGVQTIKIERIDGTTSKPDISHKQFQDILTVINCGIPAYLVGPAGSGKTYVAQQIAEALDLPFYYNGAISDRYMDYLGFFNVAGNYQRTPFRDAWEHGGLWLGDEFDGSFANEVLPLNAALAGADTMAFPDGMIKRHKNFRVILAANTYGKGADRQYVGRFQLDAATLNRFAFIEFNYDLALEKAIAGDAEWCEYVQAIRVAAETLSIQHVISPRASINGSILLDSGMNRTKVADMVLWQGLGKAEKKRIVAEAGV
ncbi:MAG: hypothetical protein V3S12_00915 [Acidiferrobacterales bacterium]